MCDNESVEIVAKTWDAAAYQSLPFCGKSRETMMGGSVKVRDKPLEWIAQAWLAGEKTVDYFEAAAKRRSARRVFVKRELPL